MNTAYNNDVANVLKLITVNGATYQVGADANDTDAGIAKLYSTVGTHTDGSMTQSAIKTAIEAAATTAAGDSAAALAAAEAAQADVDALETLVGEGYGTGKTVKSYIDDKAAASKSTVVNAANDSYVEVTSTTAADGHVEYTVASKGIDTLVSTEIGKVVAGADTAFDTLKEVADWILSDTTGAAAMAQQIADLSTGKKDKQTAYTASGMGTDKSIATLTQNANGEIAATFATLQDASASQHGLMSAAHYNKLDAISASVTGNTLTIVTQAA